ncbi:hypothetical protein WN73_21735 [Bradyrhizobium sp. CCBAU 45394]|nr:hypothetical protein [Bradyrhizobium sp. CCBAU 45394]
MGAEPDPLRLSSKIVSEPEKVLKQCLPLFCKYGFRMELYSIGWLILMRERHDFAFLGTSRHRKSLSARLVHLDDKSVIAPYAKRKREPEKQPATIMHYVRRTAVHRAACTYNPSTESTSNTLVSEADPEDWDTA